MLNAPKAPNIRCYESDFFVNMLQLLLRVSGSNIELESVNKYEVLVSLSDLYRKIVVAPPKCATM